MTLLGPTAYIPPPELGTDYPATQRLIPKEREHQQHLSDNLTTQFPKFLNLCTGRSFTDSDDTRCCVNPLKPELNPIYYLLALLAHHFLHVSRIRVKSLTFRRLMSYIYIYIYIYGAPILDVSRSHTTTQHSR